MSNVNKKYTFLTYICSKDPDKLTSFVWQLPRIEIKEIIYSKGKWFCWFTHRETADFKTSVKNLDLDKL